MLLINSLGVMIVDNFVRFICVCNIIVVHLYSERGGRLKVVQTLAEVDRQGGQSGSPDTIKPSAPLHSNRRGEERNGR